jgi:hypothetical protein
MASADFSLLFAFRLLMLIPLCGKKNEISRGKIFNLLLVLPDLPIHIPSDYRDYRLQSTLPHINRPTIWFLFVNTKILPPSSFRFYLAVDTLDLSYEIPVSGLSKD